ncbi:MAG: lipopolysaccharide heptosyltransferase II [Candidatus Gorgyraea atricola]|nr:lipopolysaccharide heptosyltransferase II [Candidatus Gorgyraea atricola]
MKRILIVNVNWLGDTIFATPFIRAVKESSPGSYVAILTHSRCKEVLENNPHIDEIITYDRGKFSLILHLRSRRFDTAFILRRSLSRTILLFLSRIPNRIGYDSKKSGFLLTKKIALPSKDLHRVEHFLDIARGVGIRPKSVNYDFFISDKDRAEAKNILKDLGIKDNEDFIVLNPGGNWDLKRWPAKNFAMLGDKIDIKVILAGAEKDIKLCQEIASMMKKKPILICGKTDLKTLGAVFERAKKVVSSDSGPMHIAVAVNSSVVALFGPTSSRITGPYGDGDYRILQKKIDCEIPCYRLSCKDNKCMSNISVNDVVEAIS